MVWNASLGHLLFGNTPLFGSFRLAPRAARQFYPSDAASFKGGHHWRRRFAKRFKIGIRKKSNCKNKSWEQTEPILLRYFTGLRKRLQLGDESQPIPRAPVEPRAPKPRTPLVKPPVWWCSARSLVYFFKGLVVKYLVDFFNGVFL